MPQFSQLQPGYASSIGVPDAVYYSQLPNKSYGLYNAQGQYVGTTSTIFHYTSGQGGYENIAETGGRATPPSPEVVAQFKASVAAGQVPQALTAYQQEQAMARNPLNVASTMVGGQPGYLSQPPATFYTPKTQAQQTSEWERGNATNPWNVASVPVGGQGGYMTMPPAVNPNAFFGAKQAFGQQAVEQGKISAEEARMQGDVGYRLFNFAAALPNKPTEIIGGAGYNLYQDISSTFTGKPPQYTDVQKVIAGEAVHQQELVQSKGMRGAAEAYTGEVFTNPSGLPVIGAEGYLLGGALGFVGKPLGGVVAGTRVGSFLGSTVGKGVALGGFEALGYLSSEGAAKARGATPQEAQVAGFQGLAGVTIGLPFAIAGAETGSKLMPFNIQPLSVPKTVPEMKWQVNWETSKPLSEVTGINSYPVFSKVPTGQEVTSNVVVGRVAYMEGSGKVIGGYTPGQGWTKSPVFTPENMPGVATASPPLLTMGGQPGWLPLSTEAVPAKIMNQPSILQALGTKSIYPTTVQNLAPANPTEFGLFTREPLRPNAAQMQQTFETVIPLARAGQGVKSSFINENDLFSAQTRTATPTQYGGMRYFMEGTFKPFISQEYGSGVSYGQRMPSVRLTPGDVDVQTNLFFTKSKGGVFGQLSEAFSVDSADIAAKGFVKAAGPGKPMIAQEGKVVNPAGETVVDIHAAGTGELPPRAFGLDLMQPSMRYPTSGVPVSTLSQETASTGVRMMGLYRTGEGEVVYSPPANKATAPAQFYANALSSVESAGKQGLVSQPELTGLRGQAESLRNLKFPLAGVDEGWARLEKGTLSAESPTVRSPGLFSNVVSGSPASAASNNLANFFSLSPTSKASAGYSNAAAFSGVFGSGSPSRSASPSSLFSLSPSPSQSPSRSPFSSRYPFFSPSPSPSQYYSFSPSPSPSGSSSPSGSGSPSPSPSGSGSGVGFPLFPFPSMPSGAAGTRRPGFTGSRSKPTRYMPSLLGIFSGRTVKRAPSVLTGGEVRFPIAPFTRRRGKRR